MKAPELPPETDAPIARRITARCLATAETLLMQGAIPWDIDAAMIEFGFAIGPFEAQDLSGLDLPYLARKKTPPHVNFAISDRMVQMGRLGKKSGVGWYRYPGGGGAVEDPLLEDLITEESYFAKITRREYTLDELRHALLCAMADEGAQIIAEGRTTAAEIDRATIAHNGFPQAHGGLMTYAHRHFKTSKP